MARSRRCAARRSTAKKTTWRAPCHASRTCPRLAMPSAEGRAKGGSTSGRARLQSRLIRSPNEEPRRAVPRASGRERRADEGLPSRQAGARHGSAPTRHGGDRVPPRRRRGAGRSIRPPRRRGSTSRDRLSAVAGGKGEVPGRAGAQHAEAGEQKNRGGHEPERRVPPDSASGPEAGGGRRQREGHEEHLLPDRSRRRPENGRQHRRRPSGSQDAGGEDREPHEGKETQLSCATTGEKKSCPGQTARRSPARMRTRKEKTPLQARNGRTQTAPVATAVAVLATGVGIRREEPEKE